MALMLAGCVFISKTVKTAPSPPCLAGGILHLSSCDNDLEFTFQSFVMGIYFILFSLLLNVKCETRKTNKQNKNKKPIATMCGHFKSSPGCTSHWAAVPGDLLLHPAGKIGWLNDHVRGGEQHEALGQANPPPLQVSTTLSPSPPPWLPQGRANLEQFSLALCNSQKNCLLLMMNVMFFPAFILRASKNEIFPLQGCARSPCPVFKQNWQKERERERLRTCRDSDWCREVASAKTKRWIRRINCRVAIVAARRWKQLCLFEPSAIIAKKKEKKIKSLLQPLIPGAVYKQCEGLSVRFALVKLHIQKIKVQFLHVQEEEPTSYTRPLENLSTNQIFSRFLLFLHCIINCHTLPLTI